MEVIAMTSGEFNVSIRGNNQLLANKLLVLIDGRTVQEEGQNTVVWTALPIALEEIERIEVVRGPGSALWGANAFDGVVNIITKNPKDEKGTLLSVARGQFGTALGSLVHAGEKEGVSYRLSLGYHQAGEWRNRDERGLEVSRGNFLVRYQLTPGRSIDFSGGISDLPRYDGPVLDNGRGMSKIRTDYLMLRYEGPRSLVRGYWNRFDVDLSFFELDFRHPISFDFSFKSNLYNLEWQQRFFDSPTHRLIGGVQYRLNHVEGPIFSDVDRHRRLVGFFLQEEWTPAERLTLVLGGRYDIHSPNHDAFSPRGSLLYRLPMYQQVFRLSAGRAYRAPTAVELFEEPPGGNLDLRSERIVSYEAGYSALFFKRLKGEATLFYNRLSDLVNVLSAINENLERAEVYGGEIGGEWLATSRLTLFANVAHQQVDDNNRDPFKRAFPRNKINAGLRVDSGGGLSANLLIHHVAKVAYPAKLVEDLDNIPAQTPAYTLVNLRVGYRFWREKAEAAFSVFNLFNDLHREHPLGDKIGTRVLAHLTLKF